MKTVRQLIIVLIFTAASVGLFSCRKPPSAPPIKPVVFGSKVTIDSLRKAYMGINFIITSNTTLFAVVTADENSGNLYKQVYVRDNSGTFAATNHYAAIPIHFIHSTQGFLMVGDSIAINLNGVTLDKSGGGSLQLDSIEAISKVTHIKSGLNPQPIVVTIPQLNAYSNAPDGGFIFDAQLVQLNNVEFIAPNVGTTYAIPQAPPAAPVNVNKYVCDFAGNTMVAYNSGYSNFAAQAIPSNSGTMVAVANLYTTMQLTIRSFQDVTLTNPYHTTVYDTITQYFDAVADIPIHYSHTLTSVGLSKNSSCGNMAGWTTVDLQGNSFWQGAQYGSFPNWAYCPSVSNYKTTTARNDIWLISPPIVDAATHGMTYTKKMDFSSAKTYAATSGNKNLLSVLVSRTFDGTHIIPSQWTNISDSTTYPFHNINNSVGSANSFLYAHNVALSSNPINPFMATISIGGSSPTFYVAFRYQSNTNPTPFSGDSTGATYSLGALILKN
ncbi:MAG TPA: DUF5689 domain-containing protein, partial [Bacteroidia bacterium]